MKSRPTSQVLCDWSIPIRLTRKFYKTAMAFGIVLFVFMTWLFPWYFYPLGLVPQAHAQPRNIRAPGKSRLGLEHKMWGEQTQNVGQSRSNAYTK